MNFIQILTLLLGLVYCGEHQFLQAPEGKQGNPALLVFIQGAQIPNYRYISIMNAIQEAAPFPLHVLLPQFLLDISVPINGYIHSVVADSYKIIPHEIINAIGPNRFIGGHSLGANAAQIEGYQNHQSFIAAINFGASIERVYNTSYPIPILSVNGELDGLQRVSRVGEAFFNHFDRQRISVNQGVWNHPIVIVPGMNHLQFADGVNPPIVVKNLDLKPDVETHDAHTMVASIVAQFMCIHFCGFQARQFSYSFDINALPSVIADSLTFLTNQVAETNRFLGPMLEAFRLEASPNLYHICNSDRPAPHCPFYPAWPLQEQRIPSNDTDCVCGLPFSKIAVQIMSGLDPSLYPIHHADSIHDVSDTKPFHHAHIWNNCSQQALPCTINTTTVSEPMYEKDKNDSGFPSATAYEIRIKMKSRQVFQMFTFNSSAELEESDPLSICRDINQKAYDMALSLASSVALDRYENYGQKMVMVQDTEPLLPIGPLFINSKLKFKEVQHQDGKWVLEVQAIAFRTPQEGFITTLYPDSNGYHYCKVLSPARAMEWIYVDGLRRYKGLRND